MSLYRKIKMTQFVTRQRICSTLNNHNIRNIKWTNFSHDLFEKLQIWYIVHPLLQRNISSVKLTNTFSNFVKCTSSRKEILLKLMKTNCKDSVSMEKCLLNSITMMYIDIKVKHPRVNLQKLQNTQHDIVNVAEPTRLRLLTMVVTSRPVNCDISLSRNNQVSSIDTPSSS